MKILRMRDAGLNLQKLIDQFEVLLWDFLETFLARTDVKGGGADTGCGCFTFAQAAATRPILSFLAVDGLVAWCATDCAIKCSGSAHPLVALKRCTGWNNRPFHYFEHFVQQDLVFFVLLQSFELFLGALSWWLWFHTGELRGMQMLVKGWLLIFKRCLNGHDPFNQMEILHSSPKKLKMPITCGCRCGCVGCPCRTLLQIETWMFSFKLNYYYDHI